MKVTKTNNQLVVKTSGVGQIIGGLAFTIVGAVLVYVTATIKDSHTGKKAPGYAPLICGVFVVIGIVLLMVAKNRKVTLQKDGPCTVVSRRLIGGGPQSQDFLASDVAAVKLNTYMESVSESNETPKRKSTIVLLLKNDDNVDLGSGSRKSIFTFNGVDGDNLISKVPLRNEAEKIAEFLGVSVKTDDTSTVAGSLGKIFGGQKPESESQDRPPIQKVQ